MRRRAAFALLSLAAAAGCRGSASGPFRDAPVVLVSIDTLRSDRLPAYGYARGSTPALDAIARDGVVFERVWSHCPLTLPAHSSMFTGLLPPRHGVRDNMGFTLDPSHRTLATRFKEAGFATGGAVSAYVLRRATGIARGFELYDDALVVDSSVESLGAQQRDGAVATEALGRWIESQGSAASSPSCISTSRTPRTRRRPSTATSRTLRRRGGLRGRARGEARRAPARAGAPRPRHPRRHVRPRRRAPRPRRAGARVLPLPRGGPGAAPAAAARRARGGQASRGPRRPGRPRADAPRPRGPSPRRHGRRVAAGGPGRRRGPAAVRVLGDVVPSLPLRLERAPVGDRRAPPLRPRAAAGAVRPSGGPGREEQPRRRARERGRGDGRVAGDGGRDRRGPEAGRGPGRNEGGPAGPRLPGRRCCGPGAARRPEGQAAGLRGVPPRDGGAAGRADGGSHRRAARRRRGQPGHAGRLADARDDARAARPREGGHRGVRRGRPARPGECGRAPGAREGPRVRGARAAAPRPEPPGRGGGLRAEEPRRRPGPRHEPLHPGAGRPLRGSLLGSGRVLRGRDRGEGPPEGTDRAGTPRRPRPARLGREADAEREFLAEIAAIPYSREARVGLALFYRSQRRDAAAREILAGVVTQNPRAGADEYFAVVRTLTVLGDTPAARDWASRARALYPADPRFR